MCDSTIEHCLFVHAVLGLQQIKQALSMEFFNYSLEMKHNHGRY